MKTERLLSTLIIALFSLHTLHFTARADPTLHADHPIGMVDVPVRITVSDLTPGQLFRISATSRTPNDRALISYAVFRADNAGGIDLSTAKPLEGTYSKPDPMGLF